MKRGAAVGGVPRNRPSREPSNFRIAQIDRSIFGDQQKKEMSPILMESPNQMAIELSSVTDSRKWLTCLPAVTRGSC